MIKKNVTLSAYFAPTFTLAFTLALALCVACFTGCSNQAEVFTQKSYKVDGEHIKTVSIDAEDRQIEVTKSDDDQIHIDYFENDKEFYTISVSEDDTLKMTSATNKEWTDYIGVMSPIESRKILLQLPNALLTTLNLSTTNEDILLPDLNISKDLSLSSNDGNIIFDKLDVGNSISLNAKNGNISGVLVGSYDDYAILCDIKKGESTLPSSKKEGAKTLKATNNNGDIKIEFANK